MFVFPQTALLNSFSILTPCNCGKVVPVVVEEFGPEKESKRKVGFN